MVLCLLLFSHISQIASLFLHILPWNLESNIFRIFIKFYSIIGLKSIHIKHYLWWWVEFEIQINHIMVDLCSFSLSTTTTLTLALALEASNVTQIHAITLFPLLRDVGSVNTALAPHKWGCNASHPSPFQRDVGRLVLLEGGSGQGGRQGASMNWDAPLAHYEVWTTTFVMVHFHYSFSYLPHWHLWPCH